MFFFIILCAKCKKKTIHASIKILILLRNNFLWIRIFILTYAQVKMLTLNFDSQFLRSINMAIFHQILKVRIVSNQNCPGFLKMSKIVILGIQEAEKLHISKWPKYCGTPGIALYLGEASLKKN